MKQQKILMVEDDKDFQRALALRLRAHGFQVVRASDAVQAPLVAKRESPDIILLDLGLPGGDGHTVMDRLSWILPAGVPIIVLTARDPIGNRKKAIEAGAAAFLQKPVSNEVLLRTIRKALHEDVALRPLAAVR